MLLLRVANFILNASLGWISNNSWPQKATSFIMELYEETDQNHSWP
jgi:hypothetical protein